MKQTALSPDVPCAYHKYLVDTVRFIRQKNIARVMGVTRQTVSKALRGFDRTGRLSRYDEMRFSEAITLFSRETSMPTGPAVSEEEVSSDDVKLVMKVIMDSNKSYSPNNIQKILSDYMLVKAIVSSKSISREALLAVQESICE